MNLGKSSEKIIAITCRLNSFEISKIIELNSYIFTYSLCNVIVLIDYHDCSIYQPTDHWEKIILIVKDSIKSFCTHKGKIKVIGC